MVAARVVMKRGLRLFLRARQRDPGLDPVQRTAAAANLVAGALRVNDPPAGEHPVHVARADRLERAEAVAVDDLALEQVRHRRQRDVRVRADIDPVAGRQLRRAHVVEEDERADGALGGKGQGATHAESAQVARAGLDDQRDDVGGVSHVGVDLSPSMVTIPCLVRGFLKATIVLGLLVAGACSRRGPVPVAVDAGLDRPVTVLDAAVDHPRDAQPDLPQDVAGPPPRPHVHHAAAPRPEPAGGFKVEGAIGRAEAEAVLRGARAKVQACYDKARAQAPDLKGRVVFRLSVDGRGRVPLAEAVTSTLGGGDPELCMVEALRNLKFPPSATGAESTLTFPMTFGR
jgi:hypothetical protein